MAEEKTRGEQLFEQAKGRETLSNEGGSLKEKLVKALLNTRDLFTQPQAKDSSKPTAGTKKPAPGTQAVL